MKVEEILKLKDQAIEEIKNAKNLEELEAIKAKFLGRKGIIQVLTKSIKDVPEELRREVGGCINELKSAVITGIKSRIEEGITSTTKKKIQEYKPSGLLSPTPSDVEFDITLPGIWIKPGAKHPVTLVIEEVISIFSRLGFTIADGPDIETEYYNFDALNTPSDHPSRDIQDTYWLADGILLRTQTSPVQIRVMESRRPPVRIISPGRCYRRDRVDATHSANFHQIEGLYVDKHVSMKDLKSDITYFAREMFGKQVKVRFRPHYFPFTEPSVEYDFLCHNCLGSGCRLCKQIGWIEISGAGMVNPKVLRCVGYDPSAVKGYAFGMGVERLAMLKFGINDIRLLYDDDLSFLQNFI